MKEYYHAKHHTKFIALDYQKGEDMIEKLKEELIKLGFALKEKSDLELFNFMLDQNESSQFFRFRNFVYSVIERIKSSVNRNNYQEIINDYMKYHPYEANETKKFVYDLIRKIKTKPSKELVDAYYSMVFNDTFGTAEYVEKDDKLSSKDKLNVIKCRNILRKEAWKEAFIIYNDIEYMNLLTSAKGAARKLLGRK